MTAHARWQSRTGMTLIEMMVSLAVFSIVMAGAFSFLRSQGRGFTLGSERANTLQNMRYAANTLELDLRTMGGNVPDEQPFLIYAGADVIAFSADYTTNLADDPFAVYVNTDVPASAVTALTTLRKIQIPNTTFFYPDTNYMQGPFNSPAETIVFFFTPDSSTTRADDYVLFKKVNDLAPEAIARHMLRSGSEPFFKYFRLRAPVSAPVYVEEVPAAELPLVHSVPVHGAPNDTSGLARVDSVRGMEINLSSWNGREGDASREYALVRVIRFPNAGLATKRSCGDEPMLGIGITATPTPAQEAIVLDWNQATDEVGGELDVVRYVIWRRENGVGDWGTPFLSIPAGQPTYTYTDQQSVSGTSYQYALAAQDCTPSLSPLAVTATVAAP
jgi:prepilin-type N-terminal cleavage/methylation domain-containing protein